MTVAVCDGVTVTVGVAVAVTVNVKVAVGGITVGGVEVNVAVAGWEL